MTYRLSGLAAELAVGLRSPGVCLACLTFVTSGLDSGDARKIEGAVTQIAPTLWDEGLDETVRTAIEDAVQRGFADAAGALRELEEREFRSAIFRAVVRRLGEELAEEIRRDYAASLN